MWIQQSTMALRSYTKILEICYCRQKLSFLLPVLLQKNVYRRSELHTRKVPLSLPTPWVHAGGREEHIEVIGQFHAPAVLFQGTETQYSLNIRLGWPQSRYGRCSGNKKSFAPTGIRKPDCPPCSVVTIPPTLYAHIPKIILSVLLKAWR